ncbi:alpha amylase N-terminal ig-like domain-containing protein [Caldicellulosiruptor naganoensis]|uniref:alpha amylase N-terminal ig-like domain-containing protein n=1 Tax=Caldicellulosiruptor naganoensis TaxID=29324 RepID=UPI001F1946EB|nr:alpha amylase N-terminal ig-like domain-containing protein [Caldicellulosiruptor naganoensis]
MDQKGFAKEIYLIFSDRYEIERIQKLKMDYYMEVGEYEVYQAIVEASTPRLGYKFMVKLFDGTFKIYDQFGLQEDDEEIYVGHFHFPYANPSDVFEKPKWVEKLVVYEIFPDRFARKDKKEEPRELYPWDYCKWEKRAVKSFLVEILRGLKVRLTILRDLA